MTTAIKPIEEVKNTLVLYEDKFAQVLPATIESKRFIQTVVVAIQNKPDLLKCDRRSLYSACMNAAIDGLIIDDRHAALVPYKGTVKYLPMVKGVIEKILETGEYTTIKAEVVCENDEFESYIDETGPHWKHVKARESRGKPQLVYAFAFHRNGGPPTYEEMSKDEVMAVKAVSKTKKIWEGPFGNEMWKKSAIHRLEKSLKTGPKIDTLFAHDNENYSLEQADKPETPAITAEVSDHSTAASRAIAEEPEMDSMDSMGEEMF